LVGALFAFVAETEGLEASLRRVREAPDAASALDEWARHGATYHGRILGVARALEHVGRTDPDAATWRRLIAEYQFFDCRALAERLDREQRLAPGWAVETAADMLWALISTEPLRETAGRPAVDSRNSTPSATRACCASRLWLARRQVEPKV
jgi:hypothetical protein